MSQNHQSRRDHRCLRCHGHRLGEADLAGQGRAGGLARRAVDGVVGLLAEVCVPFVGDDAVGFLVGLLGIFLGREAPGQQDLTAHVDFTAVAEAAEALGLEPARFQPQEKFLIETGRAWIESLAGLTQEERAPLVRQFQTLTHPAQLGARFHALELAWWCPLDPEASRQARERLALK